MTKSICVFCGSQSGKSPAYQQAAIELADYFVKHNLRLVYGGGKLGLMGVLAQRIHEQGGKVLGIIPKALASVSGGCVGEERLVSTMHERKLAMHHESDAFIALPGGFGTLEELIECTTWSQLRIHQKPIGLLEVNGYWAGIQQWIEKATEEGFIDGPSSQILVVDKSIDGLMNSLLNEYTDPFANGRAVAGLSRKHWEETIL